MSLKISLGEMSAAGALAVAFYCRACGHGTRLEAERWPDDVRLSGLEPRFTCKACGARGADVRPDYNSAQREGALYRT